MLALHYSGLAMGQASGSYETEVQSLRQQLCIPANEHLLDKTHAERYMLLHGFYDNNLVLPQLDTVAVEQVFADIERFAKKHDDQDLVRELRYMRLVVQILHRDRMRRIRLLEHHFEQIKQSGKSWEVFLYSWLLGSQLLDTRGKADMGLYLLTDASETLHRGYRHPIERYLNYYLGTAHYSYNDLKGAKKYFGRALKEAERDTLFGTDIRVLNTLGLAYRKMNLLDSSDLYLNHALAISLEQGDTIMECIISGNLGENQYLRGNYDTAIVLLQKDANMALMHMDTGLASNALLLMADCYLSKGEPDKCWPLLQLGRDYAYKSKQYHRLKTLYPILAKWHALQGEPALSARYTDSAMFVVDSLERIQMQVRIVPTDELYEMNRLQIESIDQENRITQRNMIVLGMMLLLVIFFLLFQLYRTKMKLNERRLEGENTQLQTDLSAARQRLDDFLESLTESAADPTSLNTSTIITEEGWLNFKLLFDASFPGYLKRVLNQYPELTKSEQRLMCLLRLQMSNKEMAAMLGVGQNAVQQLQRRTRRKINIETSEELTQLAQTL
jgi:DNA-binding CsgD family transcriptional regulator